MCHVCGNIFWMKCYIKKHKQKSTKFFWFQVGDLNILDIFYRIQNFNWWPVFPVITLWTYTCLSPWALVKTFRALVYQKCGNYSKTKSNIIKDYHFFVLNHRLWDLKPLSEKKKPTSINSSLDKPKALIRKVNSQPFQGKSNFHRSEILLLNTKKKKKLIFARGIYDELRTNLSCVKCHDNPLVY